MTRLLLEALSLWYENELVTTDLALEPNNLLFCNIDGQLRITSVLEDLFTHLLEETS